MTDCTAGHEEVGISSTRGGSRGMYITFVSAKKQIRQNPFWALKPRGDVTRNPKQSTSGSKKGHVSAKNFEKNFHLANRVSWPDVDNCSQH